MLANKFSTKSKCLILSICLNVILSLGFLGLNVINLSYADVPVFDSTSYANLIQQLANIQQQVSYMKQNLTALGTYNWVDINNNASKVASAMSAANTLSYASSNIATKFQQDYPNYQPDQNYQQSYATIANNSLNTFNGTLQVLNMSYGTYQNDSARLTNLQSQATGATGAMQALTVNAELAGETTNQLEQLKTVMLAQASSQNAYMAQQTALAAKRQANSDALFNNGATSAKPYGSYPIDPTIYPKN